MVGWKVVFVVFDDKGDIDLEDFCEKVVKYVENFVGCMIIYFFIYGVFEEIVYEVC